MNGQTMQHFVQQLLHVAWLNMNDEWSNDATLCATVTACCMAKHEWWMVKRCNILCNSCCMLNGQTWMEGQTMKYFVQQLLHVEWPNMNKWSNDATFCATVAACWMAKHEWKAKRCNILCNSYCMLNGQTWINGQTMQHFVQQLLHVEWPNMNGRPNDATFCATVAQCWMAKQEWMVKGCNTLCNSCCMLNGQTWMEGQTTQHFVQQLLNVERPNKSGWSKDATLCVTVAACWMAKHEWKAKRCNILCNICCMLHG